MKASDMQQKLIFTLLGTLAICAPIFAQQPPDQPQGPPRDNDQDSQMHGPPHGPGQMLEHVKQELSTSDEKWSTLSPKIKTILALEHELYAAAGGPPPPPRGGENGGGPDGGGPDGGPPHGDGGGGGAPDGGNADAPPTTQANADSTEAAALHKAKHDLGDLVHQSDANADEVAGALNQIRSARSAAMTALTAAQADLKPLVDQKQEAILVAFGILN